MREFVHTGSVSRAWFVLAVVALSSLLSGCAAEEAPAKPAPTAVVVKATEKPKPAAHEVNYAKRAKHYIHENVCIAHNPDCKFIKHYGTIGNALVVHTDLYPDSDAQEPASAICGWLLMYVNDSKTSSEDVSSTAYVYGSTGSKIVDCTSPMDR